MGGREGGRGEGRLTASCANTSSNSFIASMVSAE